MQECSIGGFGQRARVDGCIQALAYMKTEIDGVNLQDVDRALAKLDQFQTWLWTEEVIQEKLRYEEGRMTVEPKEIDSILKNDAVVLWATKINKMLTKSFQSRTFSSQ